MLKLLTVCNLEVTNKHYNLDTCFVLVERERTGDIIKVAFLLHEMYIFGIFWYLFCALLLVLLPAGPFIHVCSDIFPGFHSCFLIFLSFLSYWFFLAVKYLKIVKVQDNFDSQNQCKVLTKLRQ